ncbi:acylneuraminate cytidylyltransferase [Gordonia hongkongensis]|uniref:N-acylneuraminate cytidylyltransferase n=1 Tax=Gordonia hongkongensis TaxID=1701090 RepID=A0AAX3TAY1_9ACTN|nr:acylneuraminate cytidylyltransferase [Gordonia hongkongensis]QIK49163.1 acylneuraminate cytidylyltransferase [Gordonia terrae]WFP25928.1 acylneuraminate cytidylyltransferase [Gordonia hongkongensis]
MAGAVTNVCAVIPARGGSKGIPRKNLVRVHGQSLVERAVRAARTSDRITQVYVSTDDADIGTVSSEAGAKVIWRPDDLSTDIATSEDALLHACEQISRQGTLPDIVVFIQATSPFIASADLDRAVTLVCDGTYDSVFAAARSHRFLWTVGEDGQAKPLGHPMSSRPRRQDMEPQFTETGAFYVFRYSEFETHRHRFFGRVGIVEVDSLRALEIDEKSDVQIANSIAVRDSLAGVELSHIRAIVTDFDGVHTTDHAHLIEDGTEVVTVNRSDGLGIERALNHGLHVAILSKESNPVVTARARKLNVDCVQNVSDKAQALTGWAEKNGISISCLAYLGNDINDITAMQVAGVSIAVADAHDEVRDVADLVLEKRGGHGAVRELCELVIAARSEFVEVPGVLLDAKSADNGCRS